MNSTAIKRPDFTTVTEMPGGLASREQLSMLYTRYRFAAGFCQDKKVLEIGCGAGIGLGYLGRIAKKVTGVDIDEQNLKIAAAHYQGKGPIDLRQMDAHELAFDDNTFDVIILFEAIYYLQSPEVFLNECRRVLRENGTLLINTVNPEWKDFNPSPFSTHYFTASALRALLESCGFKTDFYGAFSAQAVSFRSKISSLLKRSARNLGLIPSTMKGKEWLKRIFFGKLQPLPAEVHDGLAEYSLPVSFTPALSQRERGTLREIPSPRLRGEGQGEGAYKVIYAVGKKEN